MSDQVGAERAEWEPDMDLADQPAKLGDLWRIANRQLMLAAVVVQALNASRSADVTEFDAAMEKLNRHFVESANLVDDLIRKMPSGE